MVQVKDNEGDAKTGSCDCLRRLNCPFSGNNISSSTEIPPPPKAFAFEPLTNGNSPFALFGDKAKIANSTTTRSCSCGGRLNNPPSESKISSTPSVSAPLFGPASVPSHTTNFLASQETPNPFQAPTFAQFPWNGSVTAIPVNAAIPNNYCSSFTSLYGMPSWSADGRYPYGLPQHILLMVLSPVPTTPLFSTPYSSSNPPYATPSSDNQLKNCTCCCKCNKTNNEPKQGFTFAANPFASPFGCGSGSSSSASPSPFPSFSYKNNPFSGGSAPPLNVGSSSPSASPVLCFARFARAKAPSFEPKQGFTSAANPQTSGSTNFGRASMEPVPNHGFSFTGNSRGEANPPSSGFCFTPGFKYAETVEEGGPGKLVSISAMPAFGNRSVEELRWNNCQSISAMADFWKSK